MCLHLVRTLAIFGGSLFFGNCTVTECWCDCMGIYETAFRMNNQQHPSQNLLWDKMFQVFFPNLFCM